MRYGLVGTGYWATEVHAAGLAALDGSELVGVWGRDPGKATAVADRFGIRSVAEPDALFAEVDAVAFAVPPDVQAPLAARAAAAGCHLLLEKPLALDVAAADEVVTAVAAAGVASTVFFTSRFVPPVATWLDGIAGAPGWVGARAVWLGSLFHPDHPFGPSPWRRSHGALWDVGPHALAMTLPVLGPVGDVTAVRGPGDTVHLVLRHTGGGSSSLLLSLSVPEAAATSGFEVYGEAGWARMPTGHGVAPVDALRVAAAALAGAAAGSGTHPCDAAFGREVVEVLVRATGALEE